MTEQKNALQLVCTTISKEESKYKDMLPAHIAPQKFIRAATNAVQSNPDILQCDRNSLYLAVEQAARDGMIVDGKESALVSFNQKGKDGKYHKVAKYMPMVAGIMKLARNSGEVKSISAYVVYEKEVEADKDGNKLFEWQIVDGVEHVMHKPIMFGERGKPVGAYATATLKDDTFMFEWMTIEQIEKVRAVSKAKDSGPWKSWWEEMAKKTVIRRLAKRLPSSSDKEDEYGNFINAVQSDDEMYDLEPAAPAEEERPKKKGKTKAAQAVQDSGVIDGTYETVEDAEEPPQEAEAEPVEPAQEQAEGDIL
ncbi:MAG: recombinase RecT [Alphaproteobacteria bacterium]